MDLFNSVLTFVAFLPFTLLAGYYFLTILRRTLEGSEELTTWRAHLYFGALVGLQVIGVGLLIFGIYLVIYAGLN